MLNNVGRATKLGESGHARLLFSVANPRQSALSMPGRSVSACRHPGVAAGMVQ